MTVQACACVCLKVQECCHVGMGFQLPEVQQQEWCWLLLTWVGFQPYAQQV